jgi:hypothetical protein
MPDGHRRLQCEKPTTRRRQRQGQTRSLLLDRRAG